MESEPTPREQAIAKMGGVRQLAEALGIRHQAVCQWRKIPVLRVIDIERITGISRHVLRPDVYPVENKEAAE